MHSDEVKGRGLGNLNLQVENNRDTGYSLQPAVELQGEWQTGAGTLLRASVTSARPTSSTFMHHGAPRYSPAARPTSPASRPPPNIDKKVQVYFYLEK